MKWCQKSPKIVIFKGDDTNFPGNGVIYFELDSEMSFEGLSAHFEFLGVKRTWNEIPSDRKLAISFSNEETSRFPNGAACAELWLENGEGKKRTIANNIEIVTTSNVDLAYKCIDDKIINVSIVGAHIPEDLFRLEGKVDELTIKVDQLETDLNGYKQSVDGLGTFVGQMAGQLNSTTATANKNKQDIVNIDARVEEIENELAGGGGGGVSTLMVETTHAQLKSLVQSGSLVPGMQYRITDYVATTVQEHTQSANHPFDIIVTADSADELNEVARAIFHDGDTHFANCNLEAWKICYSLDNDTNRFGWADSANGKGVIYRMIDEFGNDCPYDFKGIKTNRFNADGSYSSEYHYTFDNDGKDNSLYYDGESALNISRENKIAPTYEENGDGSRNIQTLNRILFSGIKHIGNTLGCGCYKISFGNECKDNSFANDCREIFLDGNCNENIFGVNCSSCNLGYESDSNTFGTDCYDNQLGSYCVGNKFGNNCTGNRLGLDDNNEMLGSECNNNTFQNDCSDNLLHSMCSHNFFDNNCARNELLEECTENTFGNYCGGNALESFCYGNTLGPDCYGNTFGPDCEYNTLGPNCHGNTFGETCYNNTLGANCYENTFDSGCEYNTFDSGCVRNYFGIYCSYNAFGSVCTEHILDGYCTGNTFGENCYSNTFGKYCYSNTFGPNCEYNTLGPNCYGNTFGPDCDYNTLAEFFSAIILQNSVYENTIDCTEDRGEYEYCRNIEIKSGVIGKEINIDDVEQSYHTEIRPENSITISI